MKIEIASVFAEMFSTDKMYILLKSGRDGGKTTVAIQWAVALSATGQGDIIIARSDYAALGDTMYNEFSDWVDKYGLRSQFRFYKNPLNILNKATGSHIYFKGVGGADKSRTRGMKTLNPVIAVIFDEVQQLKDRDSLEQAHASFRRLLAPNGKMLHLFNPEARQSHWLNIYYQLKSRDPDWLCITSTYLDVAKFLQKSDIRAILKMKREDPTRYNWMYLGEAKGGFGSIYPQFDRAKHLISPSEYNIQFAGEFIRGVIVGCDGAVTHDCTSLVPLAIMSNGQAVVLDIFHHDPLISGQKSSAELIPYIKIWLGRLLKKYSIEGDIPIIFKVDSAAPELTRQLAYHLGDRCVAHQFKKYSILEMVDIVQSALAKNVIKIIDFGGVNDFTRMKWRACENPLVVQLESMTWNDKQTGYDPSIPNDDCDAFTYGVCSYFKNPDNLYWLDLVGRQDYYETKEREF